jgi:hypothetical protein
LANFNAFVYCWWTSSPSRFNIWLSKQLKILGSFHVEEIWTRFQQNANTCNISLLLLMYLPKLNIVIYHSSFTFGIY